MSNAASSEPLELALLPIEIIQNIFRVLDPIALITTSQTCRLFRQIIKPARKHLADRLLALELDEIHGGVNPNFIARTNQLTPSWNDKVWEDMRWTCTRCVKLLRHTSFDNRSLLRLRYRKPRPGSPAAKKFLEATAWEPVEQPALTAREQRRKHLARQEAHAGEKLTKVIYECAVTEGRGVPKYRQGENNTWIPVIPSSSLDPSTGLTYAEVEEIAARGNLEALDRIAASIEDHRAGSHRSARMCNECRFQLGRFENMAFVAHAHQNPHGPIQYNWQFGCNKGTAKVPIIRSRRLNFATPLDRYFPSLSNYTTSKRPDYQILILRIYRLREREYPVTTHMVRCPSCQAWQELRNFRRDYGGWSYGEWIGIGAWMSKEAVSAYMDATDLLCCNRCYLKEHGEEVLAQQLLTIAIKIIKDLEAACLSSLQSGGAKIGRDNSFFINDRQKDVEEWFKDFDKLRDTWTMVKPSPSYGSRLDVDAADLEDNVRAMGKKRQEWLELSSTIPRFADHLLEEDYGPFQTWHEEWDDAVQYWRWLRMLRQELTAKPELLVNWASDQPKIPGSTQDRSSQT